MLYSPKKLSCISLLLLSGCYAFPGSPSPQAADWNHMDYAALTCDPDKPPASCPPLHPKKTITVATNGNPNNNPVIPNNNADTRSNADFNNVETHAAQSDVQHSAAQNNNGFSAAENNSGEYGYYSDSFPGTENQTDIQKSADQNNLGFSSPENNHGAYGYFGGHK